MSAADLKALEARVQAAEERVEECVAQNAAQDAKIGALRDKPAPPNPPAAAARPPAAARRQLSSATGDETEFAITGRKATLSFNSRTPDLTDGVSVTEQLKDGLATRAGARERERGARVASEVCGHGAAVASVASEQRFRRRHHPRRLR